MIVDLARFRTEGSKIFSGREQGHQARKKAGLDKLDGGNESVVVQIPSDVFSVNSSFFLGMFAPSIKKLGADGFKLKYQFEGRDISRVVDAGIRVATTTSSPFFNKED